MEPQWTDERLRALLPQLLPSLGDPVVLTPLTVVPSTEIVSSGHGLRRKLGTAVSVVLGLLEGAVGGAGGAGEEGRHMPPTGFTRTEAGRFVGYDEEIEQLERWLVTDGAVVAVLEPEEQGGAVRWHSEDNLRPEPEDVGGDIPYLRLTFTDTSQVGLRMSEQDRKAVLAAL